MKLLWVSAFLTTFVVLMVNAKVKRRLYEGDLLLTPHEYKELKTGGAHGQKRGFTPGRAWPDGKIPFELDSTLADNLEAEDGIRAAMKEWMDKSCVKFVPRSDEEAYLSITDNATHYPEVCASTNVGYTGTMYWLLLARRCWSWHGMIIHELGHVIGYLHEHTRPDRDDYLTVKWKNIKTGRGWDFERQNNSDPSSYVTPYDYSSIMHYGDTFASKNDEKTLVATKPGASFGHWEALSDLDIQQVNLHYNCPADSYTFEKFICQKKQDRITCYGGRKIKITSAYYGRKQAFKCGFGFDTNCVAEGSEEKIKEVCDGKDTCLLHASNGVYGNPCKVISSKYIHVKYQCAP